MKALALSVWIFFVALIPTGSFAVDFCEPVPVASRPSVGAAYLEKCGNQLRFFALKIADSRWRQSRDQSGNFYIKCTNPSADELGLLAQFDEYMETLRTPCPGEPAVIGEFIAPDKWKVFAESIEKTGAEFGMRRDDRSAVVCPAFDLSVPGMTGRAVCTTAHYTGLSIFAVVGDEQIAFHLTFRPSDGSLETIKEKVQILASQLQIERGTGDAALLRWIPSR